MGGLLMPGIESFLPGDGLSAAAMMARVDAIRAATLSIDPACGLELLATGTGRALRDARARAILGTLAGTGPAYAFVEAVDAGAGGEVDGPRVGTAHEVNGKTGLAGRVVRLFPDRSGAYRFQHKGRGTGGGGGVGVIPNCFCTTVPATLKMTSADPNCNYRMFQSCTIQYGPTPAGYAALNLPANTFLSVESFTDPLSGGASFQYFLTCLYNQFSLSRIYLSSPFGSPYRDGVLYSWVLGGYGNTCSPFRLDSGSAYPGSDATCGVTIDAA
jgi:hypothetical protein